MNRNDFYLLNQNASMVSSMKEEKTLVAESDPREWRAEVDAATTLAFLARSAKTEHRPEAEKRSNKNESVIIPERFTKNGRKKAVPFPLKLMKVLSMKEYRHIITWMPHGKSFVVIRPKVFVAEILPKHFKSVQYASFLRKLNRWGFARVDDEAHESAMIGEFYHENFLRDRVDLAEQMAYLRRGKPMGLNNTSSRRVVQKPRRKKVGSSVANHGSCDSPRPESRPATPPTTKTLASTVQPVTPPPPLNWGYGHFRMMPEEMRPMVIHPSPEDSDSASGLFARQQERMRALARLQMHIEAAARTRKALAMMAASARQQQFFVLDDHSDERMVEWYARTRKEMLSNVPYLEASQSRAYNVPVPATSYYLGQRKLSSGDDYSCFHEAHNE